MKKRFLLVMALFMSVTLTGCMGTIDTGNVGVRTVFGEINLKEEGPGFYTSFFSDVDEYTTKETSVEITDLTPKALDKLMLKDLDVAVFYETNPTMVADFRAKRAAMSATLPGDDFTRVGYVLIDKLARGAVSSAVSKFDSQKLHSNREALEAEIHKTLQAQLNESDPGTFKLTRVSVSSLLTDSSVEDSIRKNAQAENEIAAATKRVLVTEQQALANQRMGNSLSPMLLQYEYIKAIDKCAANSNCTLLVGSSATPMLNIHQK